MIILYTSSDTNRDLFQFLSRSTGPLSAGVTLWRHKIDLSGQLSAEVRYSHRPDAMPDATRPNETDAESPGRVRDPLSVCHAISCKAERKGPGTAGARLTEYYSADGGRYNILWLTSTRGVRTVEVTACTPYGVSEGFDWWNLIGRLQGEGNGRIGVLGCVCMHVRSRKRCALSRSSAVHKGKKMDLAGLHGVRSLWN